MQGSRVRQKMEVLQDAVSRIDRRHAAFSRHARLRGQEAGGAAAFGVDSVDAVFKDGFPVFALHEVRCALTRDIAAASAFLAGLIAGCMKHRTGRIVWVCDPACRPDGGQLFPAGLAMFGIDPSRLLMVRPPDFKTALWASDEAAKCGELAAVVFQIRGNQPGFDMTATRRLMLKAQQNGLFVCILRQGGDEEANAAATRWRVSAAPSAADPQLENGIGLVRLGLVLERNRNGQTGQWTIQWNHNRHGFEHVPADHVDRPAEAFHRPGGAPQMGQVMAFERAS